MADQGEAGLGRQGGNAIRTPLRLLPEQYPRVRALFEPLRYNTVVDSVIDGNTPAWVVAADAERPTTALMWPRQDAMLVAGRPDAHDFNAALHTLLTSEVVPDARARGIPYLSLHYPDRAWKRPIEAEILPGLGATRVRRRTYRRGQLRGNWQRGMPPNWEMRRVDEMLLTSSLTYADQMAGWVRSFWVSDADFAARGLGFCLANDEAVASWCVSVFVSAPDFELGVATAPEYQGHGFATLTATAFVEHCIKNRLTPRWHCWEDNKASQCVAAKVGFESPMRYDVYRFEL